MRLLPFLLLAGCAGGPAPSPSPTPVRVSTPVAVVTATPTPTPEVDVARLVQDGQDQVLLGKPDQALGPLQQAVAAQPEAEEAHYWLMMAYQKLADPKAAQEAETVIKLAPDSAHADEARSALSLSRAPVVKGSGKRPKDVSGFEKVRLGMTEAEVKKLYGDELQPFKGRYENPDKHVPFSLMRRFGAQNLEVLFPFGNNDGRLAGIYIRPKNYPSGSQREFNQLLGTLTGLYGPPDGDENLESEFVTRQRQVWKFSSATVHLNLYQGGDLSITILRP